MSATIIKVKVALFWYKSKDGKQAISLVWLNSTSLPFHDKVKPVQGQYGETFNMNARVEITYYCS